MFRIRNLLAVGIVLTMMLVMASFAAAQPMQQATETPVPSVTPVATSTVPVTGTATVTATATTAPTSTAVATAAATRDPGSAATVTPVGTPGTLPTTGSSDNGTAALSLLLLVLGVAIVLGAVGFAAARRSQ